VRFSCFGTKQVGREGVKYYSKGNSLTTF